MKKLYISLAISVLSASNMFAVTLTSVAASGTWHFASAWSPAQVPTAADSVVIQAGHTMFFYGGSCLAANVQVGGTLSLNTTITIMRTLNVAGTLNGSGAISFSGTGHLLSGSGAFSSSGNYTFAGTGTINNATTITKAGNIILNTGVTVTNNGTINLVGGSLTLASGSNFINNTNASLLLSTSVTSSGGTLTATANPNTVTYSSSAGIFAAAGNTYHHLSLSNAGTKALLANTQVNGNFTINAAGSPSYNGNGFLLSVAGNWTNGVGIGNTSNAAVTFNGSSTQNINKSAQENFTNLTIASSGTVLMGCNIQVTGSITINSGTFDASTANRAIYISGNWDNTGGTFTPRNGTVIFQATSGTQTISKTSPPETFANVIKQNAGTATVNSSIALTGNMTITGGTLDGGSTSSTIFVNGNWSRTAGTFSGGNGTVNMINTGTRTLTAIGGETYNNFVMNKTAGGSVTLGSAITCTGTFTLTAGTFDVSTSNHSVTIAGNTAFNATLNSRSGNFTFNRASGLQLVTATVATTFYDLTVNCTGVGIRTTTGTYTITNSITPTLGMFQNTGGTITLVSNATKTAIIGSGSGTFFGTFILQRFISSRPANWHDFGSAVTSSTLSDWDGSVTNEMYMSGVGGPDGDACCPTFQSVTTYDEAAADYVAVTSVSTSLTPTVGYQIFLGDDLTTWTATRSLDTRGTPNSGTQTANLTFSASADPGANLISNPFHSHVDFSLLTTFNVDPTFYMLDNNGNYNSFTGSVSIPPMQGFFVYALGAGAFVDFEQSSKTTSTSSAFNRIVQPTYGLRLKLTGKGTDYWHEISINFDENATKNYDLGLDARYVKTPVKLAPSICMIGADNILTTRNTFAPTQHDVIALKTKIGFDGNYSITLSGIENAAQYSCIILEDLQLGTRVNLKDNQIYSFDAKVDDDQNRFVLHLISENANCVDVTSKLQKPVSENMISVNSNGSANPQIQFNLDELTNVSYTVYNAIGELISTKNISAFKQAVDINIETAGVYFVNINVNNSTLTRKIVINK